MNILDIKVVYLDVEVVETLGSFLYLWMKAVPSSQVEGERGRFSWRHSFKSVIWVSK